MTPPIASAHRFELLAKARVVITGGLGFIGSNLAIRLVDLGADVRVVDSLIPEYGGNLFNVEPIAGKVTISTSDIRDTDSLHELIEGRDLLFNLAGQTAHLDSMRDPLTDLEINCRAQLNILEASRRHNPGMRIVFASTRQVYGRPRSVPVSENHPLQPVDVNGINKLAAEFYHLLYAKVHGMSTSVLRLTNTVGPRMRVKDARQTFVGLWIRAVLEGREFEVWDGSQVRDFTYVDDAVDALLLAATRPEAVGQVYNLGGVGSITLRELADLLVGMCGAGSYRVVDFPAAQARIDIGSYVADAGLIDRHLGWRAHTTIEQSLRKTLEYFEANLPRYL